MNSISAVILTKNEETNIEDCIKSILFCNEILIIDDNSTDKTITLAKKLGAKVVSHSLDNDFSAQRNFALKHAKNNWVFFIDADERVTEKLKKEILNINLEDKSIDGYKFKRHDYLWGKQLSHGEIGELRFLRLFKKNGGAWTGKVHESFNLSTKIKTLKNPIIHFPHPTVTDFLNAINIYSNIRAQELYSKKVSVSFFDIIFYPVGKFLKNYFLKKGFLDGTPGFILAMMMSFHSFLVRSKLWIMLKK